jgi:hypothetical protein
MLHRLKEGCDGICRDDVYGGREVRFAESGDHLAESDKIIP